MSFTTITVKGRYRRPDGSAAIGTVEFVLSGAMSQEGDVIVPKQARHSVTLDADGEIVQDLKANTDPDTQPQGRFYRVIERIDGEERRYNFELPHDAPDSELDLADIIPVEPLAAIFVFPASGVLFSPAGLAIVTEGDVQGAIEELDAWADGTNEELDLVWDWISSTFDWGFEQVVHHDNEFGGSFSEGDLMRVKSVGPPLVMESLEVSDIEVDGGVVTA